MSWSAFHASALSSVFTRLNDSGIAWMVLRNYEGLPENNRSKDVDLLFDKKNFRAAKKIISEAVKDHGFDYYLEAVYQYVWCYTFFSVQEGRVHSVKIDLLDGFVWRGAQVVSFDALYKRRVQYNDFFVPDPVYDGFMLWIKPLMTGGFIKEKYRPDIMHTIETDPVEFRSLLTTTFGESLSAEIWPFLEQGNLDGTVRFKQQLSHAAWLRSFHRHPFKTIISTADHFYKEVLRRSRRPKASMLAVIGPDGVGKSTFIEQLQAQLGQTLVKDKADVFVLHFRPNIFPNIKRLFGGKKYDEKSEEFTSPHRSKPAGIISSFLRLMYYWLDYVLGYWLKIRTQCIAGQVYIFDRYFYDFIVDPYRSRIKLPKWLRMIFLKMVPEPDMVFFLDCDAATIYSRKQELSLAEIERQLQEYRLLANSNSHFIVLDAAKRSEDLCNDAVHQLIEKSFNS